MRWPTAFIKLMSLFREFRNIIEIPKMLCARDQYSIQCKNTQAFFRSRRADFVLFDRVRMGECATIFIVTTADRLVTNHLKQLCSVAIRPSGSVIES